MQKPSRAARLDMPDKPEVEEWLRTHPGLVRALEIIAKEERHWQHRKLGASPEFLERCAFRKFCGLFSGNSATSGGLLIVEL